MKLNIESIVKMQNGGGMPPFTYYSPVTTQQSGDTSQQTTAVTSVPQNDNNKSVTDKDLLEMVKSIKGLPSDTDQVINSLTWMYQGNSLYNKGNLNTSTLATRYLQALNKVNNINFNKEQYDSALKTVEQNGGLNEIAITNTGRVIAQNEKGEISQMGINDYLKNQDKYSALKNSDLLYLRAHDPNFAFKNDIFNTIQNGIGMDTVTKSIESVIEKLGSNSVSKEGYAQQKSGQVLQGLELLKTAVQNGADFSGMGIDGIYKVKMLNNSQKEQAISALNYIYKTLPQNAINLLKLKSGDSENPEKGAMDLLTSLVTSQAKNIYENSLTYEDKMSSDANGTGDSKSLSEMKQLDLIMNGKSSLQKNYIMNPRSNFQYESPNANFYSEIQEVSNGKGIQTDTLKNMLVKSGLSAGVMQNSIYFGNNKISPEQLGTVIFNGYEGAAQAFLPFTKTSDGGIAPNLGLMKQIETVENSLKNKGNITPLERKQAYTQAGIGEYWDITLDPQAAFKKGLLRPFIMVNGITSDNTTHGGIVKDDDDPTVEKLNSTDQDYWAKQAENIVNSKENNDGKKGDFSVKSWFLSEWISSTKMYSGTIFMPMTNDKLTAFAKTGNINLPKSMFNANTIMKDSRNANNYEPVKTNFNE